MVTLRLDIQSNAPVECALTITIIQTKITVCESPEGDIYY